MSAAGASLQIIHKLWQHLEVPLTEAQPNDIPRWISGEFSRKMHGNSLNNSFAL
jgi:hypothetical protein